MKLEKYSDDIIVVQMPSEPDIRMSIDNLIVEIEQAPDCHVVVDFTNVGIMTSMTLSGFLQLQKLITAKGQRLIFTNASPLTKEIFAVTCFDDVFEFMDSREKAIESINQPAKTLPATPPKV